MECFGSRESLLGSALLPNGIFRHLSERAFSESLRAGEHRRFVCEYCARVGTLYAGNCSSPVSTSRGAKVYIAITQREHPARSMLSIRLLIRRSPFTLQSNFYLCSVVSHVFPPTTVYSALADLFRVTNFHARVV